jgi:hypothetical protein
MHQRQRVRVTTSVHRMITGLVTAVTLAVALHVVVGWSPICVLLTPDDPLWYVFMCWYDPPDPPKPIM